MVSFYREQMDALRACDPEILNSIINEGNRQREHIELIASENYVSDAILEAAGSCLTNKYAEGYPGNRFYGGCAYVDEIERIAIDRAKKLFKADHVNVQPHSGSQANSAAYFALLNSGDTVMGMGLKSGGHLTHGSTVNISGKIFNFVQYGVSKETGLLDYDKIRIKAEECKPKLIVAGASAYPRSIDFKAFRDIADSVGAYLMVDMAHIAGLVAAGLHESPIPYADIVTTTTHKTLRGPRGGMILCKEQFAEAVDKAVFPCCQGGPLMHIIAAKAVCFKEALDSSFIDYQKQVIANAKTFEHELIANGVDLVTGGTDNHLLVLKTGARTGLDVQNDLEFINISCNKETIPGDQRTAIETSGIRIGTPAITTRGLKENDVKNISQIIARVISGDFNPEFEKEIVREILSSSYKETLLDVIHRIKTNLR